MRNLLFLMILANGPCFAAPAVPPGAADASSAAAKAYSVTDLYNGQKYRDPFLPLAGAGAGAGTVAVVSYNPQDVDIHSLNVKGILRDKVGAFALLQDSQSGFSFVLKNGSLFDYRNKRVPGITGVVHARQKTVILMTPDKDVQTLRLGETEENAQSKAH